MVSEMMLENPPSITLFPGKSTEWILGLKSVLEWAGIKSCHNNSLIYI